MSENENKGERPGSNETKGTANDPRIEEVLLKVQNGADAITKLAETAKIQAKSAEENEKLIAATLLEAQSKTSEIAAAVTQVTAGKSQVEAVTSAATAALENQKVIGEILIDTQAKSTEIASVATQALAAKTQIIDLQAIIATKSDHIQKAQDHADTVRASLDRELTGAKQQATETEGEKARAQSAANNIADLQSAINSAKTGIEKDGELIAKARETAEQAAADTKKLAEISKVVETRIAEYEHKLLDLQNQCKDQLGTIEKLLPGATSTGLAHAFDHRRTTFLKPQVRWQWVFVGSLIAIIGVTVYGLLQIMLAKTAPSFHQMAVMWLSRLPVVGALVWLAMHASRESALAKRLEEDYGYKSAVATSFMGFHKQLETIANGTTNEPLAKLCGDTLNTIATPPGRIYDKHKLTVSPTDELMKAAEALANALAKVPKISAP